MISSKIQRVSKEDSYERHEHYFRLQKSECKVTFLSQQVHFASNNALLASNELVISKSTSSPHDPI